MAIKRPFRMIKGQSRVSDLVDGPALSGLGAGNIYYVIKETASYYGQFFDDYNVVYSDGSSSVCSDKGGVVGTSANALLNTGIQDALNKCVDSRNDYVIVMPSASDYDIGAALTLTKKAVHLLCPAGLGNDVGATNAARIHQCTAATPVMTLSNASIEVAGFYFKNYTKVTAVEFAQNAYAPNFHNNTFSMTYDGTTGEPLIDNEVTGNTINDGGSWGSIERNWFVSNTTATSIALLVNLHSNATAARFKYNELTIGDGCTCTLGVYVGGVKGACDFNVFHSGGGASGGAFTHCISVDASGSAFGNRGAGADGIIVTGGTANLSFSDNMNSASGGAVDDAT
jgi:hypothetical protein